MSGPSALPLRWLLLALAMALTPGCAAPRGASGPPTDPERFHLFLLAGQSNMAGRGGVEAEDRVPHPRVWTLDREGRWVPAVDPLHFDKPDIVGVGPGRSFALALAQAEPGVEIGLVPAAVGGSSIVAWEPGAVHPQTGTRPYDDAVARARAAMRHGTLKAILWHQGESDGTAELAPAYEARLDALVRRFRRDLGVPELPFVVGRLGRFQEQPWDPWRTEVDRAHRSLPSRLSQVAVAEADGLGHKGDTVHFSSPAARELGRRYAAAYLRLVAGASANTAKDP